MKAIFASIVLLIAAVPALAAPNLDQFVGLYQLAPDNVVSFTRSGDHLVAQGSGQPAVALSGEGIDKFGAPQGHWRFERNASGDITAAILTQYGSESRASRINPDRARAIVAARAAQMHEGKASPGVESALRKQIEGFENGAPDYADMAPSLAGVVQKNEASAMQIFRKCGPLTSLEFKNINASGGNVYQAKFKHGDMEWIIAPLTPDGKIDHLAFRPL